MNTSRQFLNPSEAAKRLGISAKALRLYEQRGLIAPIRSATGWRTYGPDEIARAAQIVALRALGLSLGQVGRVLGGGSRSLESALAEHQAALESYVDKIANTVVKVRRLRAELVAGRASAAGELGGLLQPHPRFNVCFELPRPWDGEQFELRDICALNYITGPLGSGKTRLAKRLAECLPNGAFLGLDRLTDGGATARARLDADPALRSRVDQILAWLIDEGAAMSDALVILLAGLELKGPAILVIDMVEQGLDKPTQEAVIAHMRRRGPGARPLFILTRSSAILGLSAVGTDEAIFLCPANHSRPTRVVPYPDAPGYEAVATCLASPEVRARTEGVIAWRPAVV